MEKEDLEILLAKVASREASTLHLASGYRPTIRILGRLEHLDEAPRTAEDLENLAREFLFADHREQLETGKDVEFLYATSNGTRFRTIVMQQSRGLSMAFHRIPTRIPDIGQLMLPRSLAGFCGLNSGLIAVAGFLGSGKSTTLAAMVNHINRTAARHIVLIERPIGFIHQSATSLVHQREVGFHVESFSSGVREACRTGADVIVVGAVPDAETLAAILDATEKGALVLTTVTASCVSSALAEMEALFDPEYRARARGRLAACLRVMVAQTLLNHAGGGGKLPLVEIMVNNSSTNRIIAGGDFAGLTRAISTSRGLGSQTSDMALRELLLRELVSGEEARYHAVDRDVVFAPRRAPGRSNNSSSTDAPRAESSEGSPSNGSTPHASPPDASPDELPAGSPEESAVSSSPPQVPAGDGSGS